MIRYVHIGDQIEEGTDQFAFYDTVTDRFIRLGGQEVFDDPSDLLEAARMSATPLPSGVLERMLRLIKKG